MGITVEVKDGKFDRALRSFKKKVDENNILKDLRAKDSYLKPSMKRKLAKSAAKKRWKKFLDNNKLPERKY